MSIATVIQLRQGTPEGPIVADLTRYATACEWSHNTHGPRALSLTAPRRLVEAFAIYAAQGLIYVVATRGLKRIWLGRLSDPGLWANAEGSGVTIRALGLWEALDDVRYTALWSTRNISQWQPAAPNLGTGVANVINDRFAVQTQSGLYLSPKKDELFGGTANPTGGTAVGALYFIRPNASTRSIEYLSFSYDVVLGPDWSVDIIRCDDALASVASPVAWGVTTNGTGTFAAAITACQSLVLRMYKNNANVNLAVESGVYYARLTNMRVNGDNNATVTANGVAGSIIAQQSIVGVGALTNPGLDLDDLVFEDTPGTAAIKRVVSEGDGISTPYVARVDTNAKLYLEPFGTGGRTWYVDLTDLELAQDRATLANAAYSVYQDASERTLRTATATDNNSVNQYGYTRTEAVAANTTSGTIAAGYRDAYLSDNKVVRPAAAIAFRTVYTASGGRESLTEVLPGDTLVVRNLPLTFGNTATLDRVRSFRITETVYDAIENRLTVTPETPIPSLDVLIAQQARPGRPARGGIGRPQERRIVG